MTIYKEDIQQSKRRIDAWWNHEIIDRVVAQVRVPTSLLLEVGDLSDTNPEAAEAWFLDQRLVIQRLKRQLAGTYFGGGLFP